ncbi:MAG: hypothetical protein Q8R47_05635 [Nanoarchaeota archaeon]|nr:hypothetical protein [Nanoarchaeota archaeon]
MEEDLQSLADRLENASNPKEYSLGKLMREAVELTTIKYLSGMGLTGGEKEKFVGMLEARLAKLYQEADSREQVYRKSSYVIRPSRKSR